MTRTNNIVRDIHFGGGMMYQWGYYTDSETSSSFTLHRLDGPAMVQGTGTYWYKHGEPHRLDGPAFVDGSAKRWYVEGKLHRTGGPAFIVGDNYEEWWLHGEIHRDGGPAWTSEKKISWYFHGRLHRVDGPALVHANGDWEWAVHGTAMALENMLTTHKLTNEEKLILKLKYSHLLGPNNN